MTKVLSTILSRADEKKALTILGAGVSIVAVYVGFGIRGVCVEGAVFAALALAFTVSR